MEEAQPPEISGLNPTERGFVLALHLLDAAPAAALVPGASGERCRAAQASLEGLSRPHRLAVLARMAAETAGEFSLESVPADQFRAALALEPSALVMALVSGLPAPLVEVARSVVRARGEDPAAAAPDQVLPALLPELRRAVFGRPGAA